MDRKHLHLYFSILISICSLNGYAQKDTISLNEVVVTGTRAQVNRNNVPMTISVIDRTEIEESSESALLPVLSERVPGMFITERGITGFGVSSGGSGGITMRGIGGSPTTEVLILIDGHPQYMGIMGHHLPDAYVASDVEKVEVIRGPASILYGSNAMGGTINIITRKQNKDGWSASGRVMYGSHNTQKYMANAGIKKGKYDGFVSVNHDRTDGHRDNSAFHITNAYARSGYNFSENIRLWGDISIASYKARNPGTEDAPMFDNIANITRGVTSATLENNYEKTDGALKLFYNFGDHKINDGYAGGDIPKDYRFRSKDNNFGAMLYQNFRPFLGNIITAGIDFKSFGGHAWNKFEDNRPDANMVDTSVFEIATYLIMQQTLFEKLTLNGGVRLEYNREFGNEWIPQIGFAYRPVESTVIKGSIAKGFRSPTLRELFMWGQANPDLKPERMINYEVSVGQKFLNGRLYAELTGFIADGSNLIQTMPIKNADGTTKMMNLNTGDLLNRGIEFSVKWNAIRNLQLQANYSYLDMDKPVVYAPKQQLFVSAGYHLQKWNLSAGYQYINDMYSVTGDNAVKENYGLLNVKASFHPIKLLELFVKGENLTDKKYEIMRGYPMPGFTVLGGINISLGTR
ncbi:MAG: TonB-dependent receptor [Prevotella sp.]|jgi:iron complex outermembrane receptor protein|nr:TonB-dependent receptor [Prevotella sp.]